MPLWQSCGCRMRISLTMRNRRFAPPIMEGWLCWLLRNRLDGLAFSSDLPGRNCGATPAVSLHLSDRECSYEALHYGCFPPLVDLVVSSRRIPQPFHVKGLRKRWKGS